MAAAGRARAAAANRLILALALAWPLAVANRLLVDSENDLWDAVAVAEGDRWALAWDTAAGLAAATPEAACAAALDLYGLAADRLATHLRGTDRAVVETAAAFRGVRESITGRDRSDT
ncbi:hypothetical protein [Glycomyces paridis]|uniref:Uncharacterized protein n=1 Tax=Glycomyces paridis TaxID=2126555 RepID=A0A4S8P7K7_9ACTN|nr:hypothetical protein [Glycomyces paridis]THV26233.1 hypothetical protein E9998_19250 [Glycomyces paridis]